MRNDPGLAAATIIHEDLVQCEEIRDPAAFAALEPEYRSLFERSTKATIYQGWEWIWNWWEVFRGP